MAETILDTLIEILKRYPEKKLNYIKLNKIYVRLELWE